MLEASFSSKFLEGLGILKHDFSIFDDGDFEDVGTTWCEGCYWWRGRTSVRHQSIMSVVPLNFLDYGFFCGGIEFAYFCYVFRGKRVCESRCTRLNQYYPWTGELEKQLPNQL